MNLSDHLIQLLNSPVNPGMTSAADEHISTWKEVNMVVDICLFLDVNAEEEIRRVWRVLRARGISSPLLRTGGKPHLTLGIWDELDTKSILPDIKRLSEELKAFPVTFSSLATFGGRGGTIFLGPAITPSLITVHNRLYSILRDISDNSEGLYRPGCWVPHCSLTLGTSPSDLPGAYSICMETISLPIRGWIKEIGLITFDEKEARSFRSYSLNPP